MEWDNVTSLALIEQYKRQPVLWNSKHKSHYSKTKKQQAWETIASNMGLTEEEVRQKINSLLGSFRRVRSKVRAKRKRGQAGNGSYTPRWFAYESMQFLLNRHDHLSDDNVFLNELQTVKFEEDDLSLDSNHLLEEELNESSQDIKHRDTEQEEEEEMSSVETPIAKKMKTKHFLSGRIEDLSIFAAQDECCTYGQYVASKLRKFNHRTRCMVEHAINNILFEADLGKYDNAPCPVDAGQRTTTVANSFFSSNLEGINFFPPMSDTGELSQLQQQNGMKTTLS